MMAEVRSDFSLTRIGELEATGHAAIAQTLRELDAQAEQWFAREGIEPPRQTLAHAIDMRFFGQSHELTIPVAARIEGDEGLEGIRAAFRKEHERVYGYAPAAPIQLVTYRVTAFARLASPRLQAAAGAKRNLDEARKGSRRAYFAESGGFVDCPVYERDHLPHGARIEGPAIVEQMDATTIVLPGQSALRRDDGQLVLSFGS
jgi:N-methylhydantoinase A